MKTIEELKSEVLLLEKQANITNKYSSEYKKAKKEAVFIRSAILYLESQPTEEFINKQLSDLIGKKRRIDSGFETFRENRVNDGKSFQQQKSEYNSLMNLTTINNQLRMIKYILA